MIPLFLDYASPSAFSADANAVRDTLGFTANSRRPVRFRGRVQRNPFLLRVAMRALGEAIWSDDTWREDGFLLDPVITVHPDRVFLEAFSQDQSTYVQLILDPSLFALDGAVTTGTTNIDFTAWLWAALGEMRSSRETWFAIDPGGFAVATGGAGGRFEAKVELPDSWVRGFLQVQGAMAMPGTRVRTRPVDLLSAIRFLRYTKAKLSPRALRYEFTPGADVRLVLEPWEHVVALRGAVHDYQEPKSIRLWGRRRLKLIEPLLPFADGVDIYLKGRGLPSFYAVQLPGMTFILGLTGWSGQNWTGAGSFDLLQDRPADDPALLAMAEKLLGERFSLGVDDLCAASAAAKPAAAAALQRLCRLGRAIFDVERRTFRHRELFAEPIDEGKLYPPDERVEAARDHLQRSEVTVATCGPRETKKIKSLRSPNGPLHREVVYRDWQVDGRVGDQAAVEIVINDRGAIIFGRCACAWFEEHLLSRGPCQHMLALMQASAAQRVDMPSSQPAEAPPPSSPADGNLDADVDGNDDVER